MKNKTFALLLAAAVCAGCFVACAARGKLEYAAVFLILSAAFAGMGVVFHYYSGDQEEDVAHPAPLAQYPYAPRPVEPYRSYRDEVQARTSSGSTFGTEASALAAKGLQGTGELVGQGITAFRGRPAFWTGVIFVILAAISFFAGMTGMATTWKAMHTAGAFALISAGFFTSAYQQWATGKEFASKHWAVIWLSLSVIGFLMTPLHKNWPIATMLVAFSLSGIAAAITVFEKWPETRAFLGTWLFTKGWYSVCLWAFVAIALLLAYIMPTLMHGGGVTRGMTSVMTSYALSLIAFGVVAVVMLWNPKKS